MIDKNKNKYEFEHSKSLTRKEKKYYARVFDELCKLISDECYKKGNNREQRIKALENNLFNVIKKYPELLYIKKYIYQQTSSAGSTVGYYDYSRTFLYELYAFEMYDLIEKLCEDVEICKLPTFGDSSLFFRLIPSEPDPKHQNCVDEFNKKSKLITNILQKHPELLSFKNQWENNFAGEIISNFKPNSEFIKPFIPFIHASLEDSEIATQQNNRGFNIGMLCAHYKHQELFNVAFQNSSARAQKNDVDDTMEMIANNNGLIVPPLSDKQVYDHYNEVVSKKIEEICK